MRLDRVATLYLFRKLVERNGLRIPILMYHSVSEGGAGRPAYFQTTTSPARFAEQMQYMAESGYTPVRLTDAMSYLMGGTAPVPRPVVITFDDGFRDFYTNAFPVLHKYGFPANMFLPTSYIGDTRASFLGCECLTWSEVRELDAAGMEFGSHTVTHPQLRTMLAAGVEFELRHSKETIEDKLGKAATTFSYPYAFPEASQAFVAMLKDTLRRCEYSACVSTVIGTVGRGADRYSLPRLPVNSEDDRALFQAKLEGGYDWLHRLQRLKKSLGAIAHA